MDKATELWPTLTHSTIPPAYSKAICSDPSQLGWLQGSRLNDFTKDQAQLIFVIRKLAIAFSDPQDYSKHRILSEWSWSEMACFHIQTQVQLNSPYNYVAEIHAARSFALGFHYLLCLCSLSHSHSCSLSHTQHTTHTLCPLNWKSDLFSVIKLV